MKLAIIGTAGRKDDAPKLKLGHWILMQSVAQTVALLTKADRLVSGGAAWADHTAVALWLDGHVPNLTIHSPGQFDSAATKRFVDNNTRCTSTLNHYHAAFSDVIKRDSFADLARCDQTKMTWTTQWQGVGSTSFAPFFARNKLVADDADIMLAFTFGQAGKPELKDGGTAHTMGLFLERRAKIEARALELHGEDPSECRHMHAYHFILTNKVLYSL